MISLRFFRKNKVILVHIFLTFELAFPGCFLQYLQPALRRQTGHNRLIFDTNHGLFSDCFQEKSRGPFLSEKGRLAKCLTRQILNKKVCTSAHCRSALQSGQRQTQNQTKGVFTMQINITARDFGGTEFLAQPHRLHLGAQKAEGVDQLEFSLPEQWNGCVVTLHIRHADGTLAEPLALDEAGCVGVGRSFTGWASGEWMLAAANGNGYTAYTRPGQYDVHGILPTEGGGRGADALDLRTVHRPGGGQRQCRRRGRQTCRLRRGKRQTERQRGRFFCPADRRQRHPGRRLCRAGRSRCRPCRLLCPLGGRCAERQRQRAVPSG